VTSNRTNLITVVVVTAMAAGFSLGALMPGRRTLTEREYQISTAVSRMKTDATTLGDVSALYLEIKKLEQDNERYRERVPPDRRFGEFLSSLSESLKAAGIEDFVLNPRPARELMEEDLPEGLKKARGMTALPVHLSFKCKFEKVFEFMSAVESFARLALVETMSITNREDQMGQIEVEMILQTYYRPDPAAGSEGARS